MKTQKSHLERQMQRSHDLAMSRINKSQQCLKRAEKWCIVITSIVWVSVVAISYILGA